MQEAHDYCSVKNEKYLRVSYREVQMAEECLKFSVFLKIDQGICAHTHKFNSLRRVGLESNFALHVWESQRTSSEVCTTNYSKTNF